LDDLAAVIEAADVVVSVCPPDAALDVATSVADLGFSGVYVDANAVAPATAALVADQVVAAGAEYVDGGIISAPSAPRLFLAGDRAAEVAELWPAGQPVTAIVLDPTLSGRYGASALKMVYGAWTKGSTRPPSGGGGHGRHSWSI